MEQFLNLPAPVKAVIALLATTSLMATVAVYDAKLAGIIAIGIVCLAAAVAAFLALRGWARKRKARKMGAEIGGDTLVVPSGVTGAADRQKLDNLRQTFGAGFAKLAQAGGEDMIYKLPWYVAVGESGSGKTEAIRHCGVPFVPGMHEHGTEMMGSGGTVNMNWWFTNDAIFLDTAGKMMMPEVKQAESGEWKEFLQLLARNRPNCPINGLLLIIPTDHLIQDSDAQLNDKAERIAAQFNVIQRALDIRFPVFVIVTKCDMMGGFREFFDDFADAQSVNQMLGWSNPDERDAPFQPSRVTEHLATVVERIKKRRLSLLRDPVPQKGAQRRTDEVDALYSLPESIKLLAPRLRLYLEKIFVAGPWSPKPLFLRGIYFSSSMRDGAALDQELAQALGLRPDQLAEAKVWEKERAYFLRDIFTEKAFRERGLVTRATNTKTMLRKRSIVLWSAASALSLAFLGVAFYTHHQFVDSIKRHTDIWKTAKNVEDWKDGRWHPIVSPNEQNISVMGFRGTTPPLKIGGENDIPLVTYHERLQKEAIQPIETGWIYRWLIDASGLDKERRRAQSIVYEASVIQPLVQAARTRMLTEPIGNAYDAKDELGARFKREADAIIALLRIESDRVTGPKRLDDLPDTVILPLLRYVTTTDVFAADKSLEDQVRKTFISSYTAPNAGDWVPKRLELGSESLMANEPIRKALERLKTLAGSNLDRQLSAATQIEKFRDDLRLFRAKEKEMDSIANGLGDSAAKEKMLSEAVTDLGKIKASIDARLKTETSSGTLDASKPSLFNSQKRIVTESQTASKTGFETIRKAVEPHRALPTKFLFKEVDDELIRKTDELGKKVEGQFKPEEQQEMAALDGYLDGYLDEGVSSRVYAGRFNTYKAALDVAAEGDLPDVLIGKGWSSYATVWNEIDDVRKQVQKRESGLKPTSLKDVSELKGPCEILLGMAADKRLGGIAKEYLEQTRTAFKQEFWKPYVNDSEKTLKPDDRKKAESLISQWKSDATSEIYAKVPATYRSKLSSFISKLDEMKASASNYDAIVAQNLIIDKANKTAHANYETKLSEYVYTVSIEQQNKWKTANGHDIYGIRVGTYANVGEFTRRKPLVIILKDPGYPDATITLSAKTGRTFTEHGVTGRISGAEDKPVEPVPQPLQSTEAVRPDKVQILESLGSTNYSRAKPETIPAKTSPRTDEMKPDAGKTRSQPARPSATKPPSTPRGK